MSAMWCHSSAVKGGVEAWVGLFTSPETFRLSRCNHVIRSEKDALRIIFIGKWKDSAFQIVGCCFHPHGNRYSRLHLYIVQRIMETSITLHWGLTLFLWTRRSQFGELLLHCRLTELLLQEKVLLQHILLLAQVSDKFDFLPGSILSPVVTGTEWKNCKYRQKKWRPFSCLHNTNFKG